MFLFHTGISKKFLSSNLIDPLSGISSPAIVFNKVVFPESVLPKIVYNLPFSKLKEIFLN